MRMPRIAAAMLRSTWDRMLKGSRSWTSGLGARLHTEPSAGPESHLPIQRVLFMSLRMVRVFAVFQVLTFSGASAFAAVQCPQSLSGRALRTSGRGTLFDGHVGYNASLAPDGTQQLRGTWVNSWRLGPGQSVTLLCRYQGTQEVVSLILPMNVRSCRQDPSSFVCQ